MKNPVKTRKSYQTFSEILESLIKHKDEPVVNLKMIYKLLEGYRAFGSRTAAIYAGESLELVIKEYNHDKRKAKDTTG